MLDSLSWLLPISYFAFLLIWSHCQAGYPPFWNEDVEKLFLSIVHGNYSFHDPYWSNVSDDVKDLIRRMVRSGEKYMFFPEFYQF